VISSRSLVALRHRDFRLLWIGLLLSFTGSFMQNAAILWHVSLLVPPERKALALGFVGLVRVVPIIVFSLISGVVADALDRRRLMLITNLAAAVVAVALAFLSLRGLTAVWPIYAQDILRVGPRGYGWLFAAPSIGALLTSAAMVPLTEHIDRRGQTLIWAVVGHGIARRSAARGIGGRPGRELAERAILRPHRRNRLPARDGLDYRDDAGAAPLSAASS
jgi:MFS family permease